MAHGLTQQADVPHSSSSLTHTPKLTYMKTTVIFLGSQQRYVMPFMCSNINICLDLAARVEILLGKLLFWGFSICHPCRLNWKCDKVMKRNILNVLENLLHPSSFFPNTAKGTFKDTAISTICQKRFCRFESGNCITTADRIYLILACRSAFF